MFSFQLQTYALGCVSNLFWNVYAIFVANWTGKKHFEGPINELVLDNRSKNRRAVRPVTESLKRSQK